MKKAPKILIVDDSLAMRSALVKVLRPLDAIIDQAENGELGLAQATANKYDLIITDVDMPVMDGFTLCRELRACANVNGTPVIILSSHDKDSDIEHGFELGASAYVSKTNAKDHLPHVIEGLLQKVSLLHRRLVMIVDDSEIIRNIIHDGLVKEGFKVISAENGKSALELLQDCKPDLIICDLNMPVMDGLSFCKTVRKTPSLSSIPFVAMSKESDLFKLRHMLQSGAATYIIKPFNVDQLIIIVEKLLSDHFQLLLKERERLEADRQAMLGSISSLVQALEARDQYTRGHSEEVSEICTQIAKKIQVGQEELENITIAARLHDVGKIGVRDDILLKPGKLTDAEFAIIKRHPLVGSKILAPIESLEKAIPIVLNHHERFDGKGYPEGLKGLDIPFWARVTAVADTYHALTSDRPYRQGLPQEKALQIIADARGTQLCPECVDIFLDWVLDD